MSDLEALGLISAPHTSAGRLPTESGLRLFVDGLLEIGDLSSQERRAIERQVGQNRGYQSIEELLTEAGELISGLSHCAGVVLAEKRVSQIKHIEFVPLDPDRAMVVLVGQDGEVDNRVIDIPHGLPSSALVEASNYLNTHLSGKTLAEARARIEKELGDAEAEFDQLTTRVIEAGLATWSGGAADEKSLIVRGRSHLLADVNVAEDMDRIRKLFDDLESKRDLIQLLGFADRADGVRIFIGSENKLFSLSGSSLIVAPFEDSDKKIVGMLGIIGPTRLNYARIIPMVDYTARLISRVIT